MKNLIYIILLLVGFGIGFYSHTVESVLISKPTVDTIYHIDTFIKPISKKVYILRVDTDSICVPGDTVKIPVLIPINQKTYSDSSYRAIISGYKVSLDSMFVFKKEVVKTFIIEKKIKPKFSLGIQSGYGFAGYYIGVGGQYNFVSF